MNKIIEFPREKLSREEYREICDMHTLNFIKYFEFKEGVIMMGDFEEVFKRELNQSQIKILTKVGILDGSKKILITSENKYFESSAKDQIEIIDKEMHNEVSSKKYTKFEIFDYIEYGFDTKRMSANYEKYSVVYFNKYLEKLLNEISEKDAYYAYIEICKKGIKTPRQISSKSKSYLRRIEEEVELQFHDFKIDNGNIIKVADSRDVENIIRDIEFDNVNFIKMSKLTNKKFNHDYIVMPKQKFKFGASIDKKDLYVLLFKLEYTEDEIIKDIEKIKLHLLNFLNDKNGEETTLRAIESNINRYNLIMSLGYGKYKITIGENQELEKHKIKLAFEVKRNLDIYFSKEGNYIVDMLLISKSIKYDEYSVENEHELYYIARKYIENFSEEYWSYRPPIVFRKRDASSEKNVTRILAKQIISLVEIRKLNNEWIDKDDFLHMLFSSSGIKENNFLQKISELENYGLKIFTQDGHRYEKGKIKIIVN